MLRKVAGILCAAVLDHLLDTIPLLVLEAGDAEDHVLTRPVAITVNNQQNTALA